MSSECIKEFFARYEVNKLPTEIIIHIIKFLCIEAKIIIRMTCKTFLYIITEQQIKFELERYYKVCKKSKNLREYWSRRTYEQIVELPLCSGCSKILTLKCNLMTGRINSYKIVSKDKRSILIINSSSPAEKLKYQRISDLKILAKRYQINRYSKYNKAELISLLAPYVREEDFYSF